VVHPRSQRRRWRDVHRHAALRSLTSNHRVGAGGTCGDRRRRNTLRISTVDISSSDAAPLMYPTSSTLPVNTANADATNTIPTITLRLFKAPLLCVIKSAEVAVVLTAHGSASTTTAFCSGTAKSGDRLTAGHGRQSIHVEWPERASRVRVVRTPRTAGFTMKWKAQSETADGRPSIGNFMLG